MLLIAEPASIVSEEEFALSVKKALGEKFQIKENLQKKSIAVLLQKGRVLYENE